MKTLREYLIENSSSSFKKIEIIVRDRENNLEELLNYIKDIGNVGHSFSIIVDPENSSTKKNFGWDGDGHDYIKSIKVNLINEDLNEAEKWFCDACDRSFSGNEDEMKCPNCKSDSISKIGNKKVKSN